MHRHTFVLFAMVSALVCVFFMIYKQTCITQLLYDQQTLEKEYAELTATQARLTQELYRLKNSAVVYDYATRILGMKKIALAHIRKLDIHDVT
jgi:cell division protein FtsL